MCHVDPASLLQAGTVSMKADTVGYPSAIYLSLMTPYGNGARING